MPKEQNPHLELETDQDAIKAFVRRENADTKAHLYNERFQQDVDLVRNLLEDPHNMQGVARRGAWLYRFQQSKEKPRGLWLRMPEVERVSPEGEWETVFDLDAFCAVEKVEWAWRGAETAWFDPNRAMLCLSLNGSDKCRYLEFDCNTKSFAPNGFDIPPEKGSVTWLDEDTLLWSTAAHENEATSSGWSRLVKKLTRGTNAADAPTLFEGEYEDVVIEAYVELDRDKPVVFVSRFREIGKEEVTCLNEGRPSAVLPTPGDTQVTNSATHYAYVVKRLGGTPGALMVGKIGGAPAREVAVPSHRRFVRPETVMVLRTHVLWIETDNLTDRLFSLSLEDPSAEPIEILPPETGGTLGIWMHDAQATVDGPEDVQLTIRGFLLSPRVYLFNLREGTGGITWRKLWQAPEAFDASGLKVELHEALSDDGTLVPYHLVTPIGRSGDLPVLVKGYGGYGASMFPFYDKILGTLWLARGGGFALAHIRGGGEFGPDWHLSAVRNQRDRAFEDFAAISRDLTRRGIASSNRIACHGRSNGGLLTGVMLTRYPELFGAVWSSVGVYDMLRYHLFPAGRAWIDEYGDPDQADAREWLRAYSPIHQIPLQDDRELPHCLIDTNSNDDRVDPSHARRFAAALKQAGHRPLFFEHSDGGHHGSSSSDAWAFEEVLGYQFLWQSIGQITE